MSSSHNKSNKKSHDSVVIDLKKTQYGYEILTSKQNTISLSKSMLSKTGKTSKDSKDGSRAHHKDVAQSTPVPSHKSGAAQKSKTAVKSTNQPTKNLLPSHSAVKEKSVPQILQEIEVKRREIFPFIGFTMPVEHEPEAPETHAPVDQAIVTDLNKVEKPVEAIPGPGTTPGKTADKTKKKYPFILPSSAHWFKLEEISQYEKESLPEFFSGKPSKTPEIYKRYRNYIIDLYRQNPKVQLSSTRCRKNLGGDACAIMRIHSFLEHWGLINFSVNPKNNQITKPDHLAGKIFGFTKNEDKLDLFDQDRKLGPKGADNDKLFNQIKILTKKHRPLCDFCGMICGLVWYQQRSPQQYQVEALASLAQNGQIETEKLEKAKETVEKPEATTEDAQTQEITTEKAPEDTAAVPADDDAGETEKAAEVAAPAEGEVEGEKIEVEVEGEEVAKEEQPQAQAQEQEKVQEQQEQKQMILIQPKKIKEMILCRKCFRDGNLPNILSHSDFEEVDVLNKFGTDLKQVESVEWTEEENVLLLEQIQKHADEWEEIQKSFPERTKEEIILHYLALPLENVTSISLTEVFKEMDDEAEGGEKPIHRVSNPFSELPDPLLQHISIFKSLLDKHRVKTQEGRDEVKTEVVKVNEDEQSARKGQGMEIEKSKPATPAKDGKRSARKDKNKKIEIEEETKEGQVGGDTMEIEKESLEAQINQICQFDERYGDMLGHVENDTKQRAEELRRHEDEKLNKYANLLVDLQIAKLETKFSFFEEYERVLWQERKNQEIFQKVLIAERVSLAHKKLEIMNQQSSIMQQHNTQQVADPTEMLNLNSNSHHDHHHTTTNNINVDDMLSLGNTEKIDEYSKMRFDEEKDGSYE